MENSEKIRSNIFLSKLREYIWLQAFSISKCYLRMILFVNVSQSKQVNGKNIKAKNIL